MTAFVDTCTQNARTEIGFTRFSPRVWSSLVNTETKLLLLTHAFEQLACSRVELKTDPRNVRSQLAIARLGATYEGTLRRHFRRPDGTIRDAVVFSVTIDDWPRVREQLTTRVHRYHYQHGPQVLPA